MPGIPAIRFTQFIVPFAHDDDGCFYRDFALYNLVHARRQVLVLGIVIRYGDGLSDRAVLMSFLFWPDAADLRGKILDGSLERLVAQ